MVFADLILQIALFITAAINAILSVVVFSRGVHDFKNIIFGLFTLSAALWTGAIIGFYFWPSFEVNWVSYTHALALLTAAFFLYFTAFFPQNIARKQKLLLIVPVFFLVYFIGLIFATDLIVGVAAGNAYQLGNFFIPYAITLMSSFFLGYFFLWRQYQWAKNDLQKKQVFYVLVGGALSPSLAFIPTLILPLIGIFQYTWSGPIFTLIMVVMLFVAMLRFHLFNIKIIITEIFTGLIILALLAQIFTAESVTNLVITTIVLVLVSVSAFLLVRSVYREVEQREEIERLAQNLKIANAKLKELDKMKNQFLSFASHDLRAPLTAIRNFMSILLDGTYGKLPPAAEEGTRQVFDRATEMAEMVDGYLNVSRAEQGRIKYDFASLDFAQLMNEVVPSFTGLVKEKGLALIYTPITQPLSMKADEGKLREVIQNLVSNAIHYTPQGSITVRSEVAQNKIKVVFEDTGIGLSKEAISKLFQLFAPGEDSKKYNTSSTGVGLYITKAHVEAHEGKIWVESEGKGKGSRFIVELPLVS